MKAETREKIKANWQLFKESLPIFLPSQVLILLAVLNLYVPMSRTMHGVLLICTRWRCWASGESR